MVGWPMGRVWPVTGSVRADEAHEQVAVHVVLAQPLLAGVRLVVVVGVVRQVGRARGRIDALGADGVQHVHGELVAHVEAVAVEVLQDVDVLERAEGLLVVHRPQGRRGQRPVEVLGPRAPEGAVGMVAGVGIPREVVEVDGGGAAVVRGGVGLADHDGGHAVGPGGHHLGARPDHDAHGAGGGRAERAAGSVGQRPAEDLVDAVDGEVALDGAHEPLVARLLQDLAQRVRQRGVLVPRAQGDGHERRDEGILELAAELQRPAHHHHAAPVIGVGVEPLGQHGRVVEVALVREDEHGVEVLHVLERGRAAAGVERLAARELAGVAEHLADPVVVRRIEGRADDEEVLGPGGTGDQRQGRPERHPGRDPHDGTPL
jgi:hypothetical protein